MDPLALESIESRDPLEAVHYITLYCFGGGNIEDVESTAQRCCCTIARNTMKVDLSPNRAHIPRQ